MAQIYNSNLTKEVIDGAGIQIAHDKVPNQLAEKIVPVMEVNPNLLRKTEIYATGSAQNATSANIITLLPDRDFYMTGATISLIKDSTSTSILSRILVVINSLGTQQILPIPGLTLTAQTAQKEVFFNPPLKLERGQTITVTNSAAVANITTIGAIFGYYN